MFWNAVIDGLAVLGHWETYLAGALYVLLSFAPFLAMAAMPERLSERTGCLTVLLLPVVQVVAVIFLVMTLAPIILGISDDAAWGMPFTLMSASPLYFIKLCVVLLAAALALAFIPFIGQIQSLHTIVLGGIVLGAFLLMLKAAVPELQIGEIDLTPPFLFTVGLLVVSAIAAMLGVGAAAAISTALERPTQGLSRAAMLPLGAVFGFIPVFIYGAWLGDQLSPTPASSGLPTSRMEAPASSFESPATAAPPEPSPVSPPASAELPETSATLGTPPADPLSRAFFAAYGSAPSAVVRQNENGGYYEEVQYKPGRLFKAGGYTVLASEGKVIGSGVGTRTSEGAAQAESGKIALHYLSDENGRFEVVQQFVPAFETGSFGTVGEWTLLDENFGPNPTLMVEGGGTWQGYTCSVATLIEVAPNGPVELVTIPISYDDEGATQDERPTTSIKGRLGEIVRDQSFDVVYTGTTSFTERYVRSGSAYVLSGGTESRMPRC